jgi:hypothetical protein
MPAVAAQFKPTSKPSARHLGGGADLSAEQSRVVRPGSRMTRLRNSQYCQRLFWQTPFSKLPENVASTHAVEVLRNVNWRIVAGKLESSLFRGMKGENA